MSLRTTLVSLGDYLYYNTLARELSDMESVLDVGCGARSPLAKIPKHFYSVGIDIFKPSIEASKKNKIHDKYVLSDVMSINKHYKKKSFDAVVALDLIEHIPKKDGFKLLKLMEEIARKKVIVLTPNGFYSQDPYEDNPYQIHKSGWEYEDFVKNGYACYGMRGIKSLRGEYATITLKPWIVWATLSTLSQPLYYFMPKHAHQLLAVKNI
jgi:SAM-dependent methyltransferase